MAKKQDKSKRKPLPKSKPPIKQKGYKTPEDVWQAFLRYREYVKSNPRKRMDFVGKDGGMVFREIERPLIIEGFKSWCYENHSDIHNYFDNVDGRYDAYKEVITRIKEFIRTEQIDGALTGDYNPNLTARINGIVDKQEIDTKASVQLISIDPLSD